MDDAAQRLESRITAVYHSVRRQDAQGLIPAPFTQNSVYPPGLRVGEVADLKLADVLDRDGTLRSEVLLAAERVKHGHSRTVFLNTAIRTELAAYIQSRSWIDAQQPLFTTHRGPRCAFSANTLAQYFYWMYRGAGLKNCSSHSGRKTFLTTLAGKGVSVFVLAALAGHRDIKTTSRYVTVNDDVKRSAVELV